MSKIDEPAFEPKEADDGRPGGFLMGFFLFAGVLLPLAALVVELGWRFCTETFFDPLPTWWHVLLVAFVPATNFQTWLAIREGHIFRPAWLSFANGVAIFISFFYALVFAPLMPLAVIAILAVFIGLLPLAPFISFIAGIIMRVRMRQFYPAQISPLFHWKALAGAFVFVFAVVGIAELSFAVTRIGIAKTNSTDPATQAEGMSLLRNYGDIDHILRLSYDGNAVVSSDFLVRMLVPNNQHSDKERSASKQAQKAYYRLTGKSYRQVPVPRGIRNWERVESFEALDNDGSFRVNNGLSLAASQLDGSVDSDAALGYLEWTLVFKNGGYVQEEAVSQIQLPPGAVVSRLTLWINGEEREAAFAKSAKVAEAYNVITAKRLDPALVTTMGKDRIQLKCSPVPPAGEMKVRIGITVPVVLETASAGFMTMPYFQDRNFVISTDHSIWIESKNEIAIANAAFKPETGDKLFGVRGKVSDKDLAAMGSPIKISRTADVRTAWSKDRNSGVVVRQELREVPTSPVKSIVFVVDPSATMAPFQEQISDAIRKLPGDIPASLVLSGGNGLNGDLAAPNSFTGIPAQLADKVRAAKFDGGTDPVLAIETAWELGHTVPASAIVWIHGPQNIELDSPARLAQLWTRRPNEVPIFSLQIGTGKNAVERSLNESDAVSTVLRFGTPQDDLVRLFHKMTSQNNSFEAVRTIERSSPSASPTVKESSQHLVRLWANDESLRLLRAGKEAEAIDVAVKNQLVTRVTGAVVLETKAQYGQFGLKPVDPNSVPTIPEPEEYLLFAVVILAFGYFAWWFRKTGFRVA